MIRSTRVGPLRAISVSVLFFATATAPAGAGVLADWPDYYDPFTLPKLYLELSNADWDTIRHDLTFEIEVPAQLWAEGESAILVSARRKSSRALPSEADPVKVGLKIDINDFVSNQTWHGVRKLSLENAGDISVVSEGFAWMLHRRAAQIGIYDYQPGLAHWVELHVRLSDDEPDAGDIHVGVYSDVEQLERQFLVNRGLSFPDASWLYEIDDIGGWALEVGDPHSPAFEALCSAPFEDESCPTPDSATLAAQVEEWINVEGLFSQAATDAFVVSPDALFSHSKNFFYADFGPVGKGGAIPPRLYFPWDLDAVFKGNGTTGSIYDVAKNGNGDGYEQLILNNELLRPVYDEVFCNLLAGPFQVPGLLADLDAIEAAVAPALAADPLAGYFGDASSAFDDLRSFVTARFPNVSAQLPTCTAIFRDNFERGDAVNWTDCAGCG